MFAENIGKLVWAALFLLALPCTSTAQGTARITAFKHITVIDMTGAGAKPHMTVLIEGDRIRAIGKTGKSASPKTLR